MSRQSLLRTASLIAVLALAACSGGGDGPGGGGTPTPAAARTVTMGVSSFSPSHVAVFANGTVTWNNGSGVLHNITFDTPSSPTDIPNHDTGSNQRTFPNTGVYDYHCTNHSNMDGRVTVVVQ